MTKALAETSAETVDTQHGKYLTFLLDKEMFGIEIKYVTEIIGMQKINPLPESADFIKGIISLRGDIIPVIDMRLRLKKEAAAYTDRTCIIVIDLSGTKAGLVVDGVDEVSDIGDQDIVPPPELNAGYQNKYIQGIGKINDEIRLLLNCKRLFETEEMKKMNHIEENMK